LRLFFWMYSFALNLFYKCIFYSVTVTLIQWIYSILIYSIECIPFNCSSCIIYFIWIYSSLTVVIKYIRSILLNAFYSMKCILCILFYWMYFLFNWFLTILGIENYSLYSILLNVFYSIVCILYSTVAVLYGLYFI